MRKQLYCVSYVEDFHPFNEGAIYLVSEGLPSFLKIKKYINMIDYNGEVMTDDDYKEFVIQGQHYTKYNIESVEEIEFIDVS